MVVKQYLESQGVDLERFQALHHSKRNPRRQLIRMAGGEITVPVPRTNKDIKETLKVCSKLKHHHHQQSIKHQNTKQ